MNRLKMRNLLILFGFFVVFMSLIPVIVLVFTQNNKMVAVSIEESEKMADSEMKLLLNSIYELCEISHNNTLASVKGALSSSWNILIGFGDISLDHENKISWRAVNQYTKQASPLELPAFSFDEIPMEKNSDPEEPTMVVDDATEIWGVGTCTIFQRMNPQGDMLRVATNVMKKDGKRAIGTYIPAVNPGGEKNPVVSAVLAGRSFYGRAFVVDDWYITAYEPLYLQEKVVGMLYYGIRQDRGGIIRNAILKKRIGANGYVAVLNGKGDYVISKNGDRDNENLMTVRYVGDGYPIRDVIKKMKNTPPGGIWQHTYHWKNPDDDAPKLKRTYFRYFKEWDWIISIAAYEEEILASKYKIEALGKRSTINFCILLGILLIVIFFVCFFLAKIIVSPIKQISSMIRDIAEGGGDLTRRIEYTSRNELGELASWFNAFMSFLQNMIGEISGGAESVGNSSNDLSNLSSEMSTDINITADNAKKATEASATIVANISDIAATVEQSSNNVSEVAGSLEEMNISIDQIAQKAEEAKAVSQSAVDHSQAVNERISEFGNAIETIAQVTEIINEIAAQTNLLALNATIEAARAGEAGKGFGVVANEIKALAKQTADATQDIRESVTGIEQTSNKTIEGIMQVQKSIVDSHESIDEIAVATDDQSKNTRNISENVNQVTEGLVEVSGNINESSMLIENISQEIASIDDSATTLSHSSAGVSEGASQLASLSYQLMQLVRRFKI